MAPQPCIFGDFVDKYDGLYQMCSCGKHIWSTRTQRLLKAGPDMKYNLIDHKGQRAVCKMVIRRQRHTITWCICTLLGCVFNMLLLFLVTCCILFAVNLQ